MAVRLTQGLATRRGFTLLESVATIVILGVALVTLSLFLFPKIQESANAHYQFRASSLGQSLLSQALSGSFEEGSLDLENKKPLSAYAGCWVTNEASEASCSMPIAGSLDNLVSDRISQHYANFAVNIWISPASASQKSTVETSQTPDNRDADSVYPIDSLEKIIVVVSAAQYGEYSLTAYRRRER